MDAPVSLVKHLLETVVNLHTTVPRDHPSAAILGDERMGSGVVVDEAGLILTVNYVVMGAQTVQVSFMKGRRQKAEVVAQDFETGLALVRVKRQGLRAAPLAPTEGLERGTPVVAVGSTGTQERRASGGGGERTVCAAPTYRQIHRNHRRLAFHERRARRRDVDGDEARVLRHEMMREREIDDLLLRVAVLRRDHRIGRSEL